MSLKFVLSIFVENFCMKSRPLLLMISVIFLCAVPFFPIEFYRIKIRIPGSQAGFIFYPYFLHPNIWPLFLQEFVPILWNHLSSQKWFIIQIWHDFSVVEWVICSLNQISIILNEKKSHNFWKTFEKSGHSAFFMLPAHEGNCFTT